MSPWLGLRRFALQRGAASIDSAIRRVVDHAYAHVPYYRRLFDEAGVAPNLIMGWSDLPLLPTVDRSSLAIQSTDDVVDGRVSVSRCFSHATSGTSGTPLTIYMRRPEHLYRRVVLARALLNGLFLRPPVRVAEIGRILKPGQPVHMRLPGVYSLIRPPGQAPFTEQVEYLRASPPDIIEGFPTALEALAQFCLGGDIPLPVPSRVVCRGEVLFPQTRVLLERAFHAPVLDFYNCEEIGNVAWQCPHDPQKMHINSSACVVEVVDRDGNRLAAGERGMLAITNLFNYTMPFIRYVLGDRGALLPDDAGQCRCGARGPSMALLDGRADDLLHLPDGRMISPRVAATVLFRRQDGSTARVYRYQLIQESIDRVVVRVVLGKSTDPDWKAVLVDAAARVLPGVSLEFCEVAEIPFEYSGKRKKILSRLLDPKGRQVGRESKVLHPLD